MKIKKTPLTVFGISLMLVIGLLSWSKLGQSNSVNPEESPFFGSCSEAGGNVMCCIDYNEAIVAAERDWDINLKQLTDQEKPASKMVDEGYESLQTFNCWLEYICRAVLYSGYAPIQSAAGTGLTGKHLGRVPGCQLPENLTMGDNYNAFTEGMKEVPLLGTTAAGVENLYTISKINYFPACMTDKNNNQNPQLQIANAHFNACKQTIEYKFGCSEDMSETELTECMERSTAIVKMETALKSRHAEQKASGLEQKLTTIVTRLNVMEGHVGYLSNFLQQLNGRFSCYARECS